MSNPKIVLFGDHPAANTGLARIHRDLATRLHADGEFEVCSLGYGHCGSANLPWPQYQWTQRDDFLPLELRFISQDFCKGEPFILMTIGDVQRFLPLADPAFAHQDRGFGEWWKEQRQSGKAKLWGYFPIDAHGRHGRLGPQLGHTLSHYDRILVPSEWAKSIVLKTLPPSFVDVLPHGIDTSIFYPRDKNQSRDKFGETLFHVAQWPKEAIEIPDDALWVGIVATNQSRKDWGLGIEVVAELAKTRPVFLWAHSDAIKREWSLLELLSDFRLLQSTMLTVGNVSDESMSLAYSAMDITLGIGRGEGFGYPIFESIFCDTPCFAGRYGAHAEYMGEPYLMYPTSMRQEGPMNLLRPVL